MAEGSLQEGGSNKESQKLSKMMLIKKTFEVQKEEALKKSLVIDKLSTFFINNV